MGQLLIGLAAMLAVDVGPARGQAPLSAIDWLSDTIGVRGQPDPAQTSAAPPVGIEADPARADLIATRVLGPASPEAIGLFPAQAAGLAPGFWGRVGRDEALALVGQPRHFGLPALADLYRGILLAELTPPEGSDQQPLLLLARIDRLLAMGALEEAAALIEQAPPNVSARPEMFRRAFDMALLLGTENDACARLEKMSELAPTLPVRIFCFVRLGDWQAAQLTLDVAGVLGQVRADEALLLARFLDPEQAEDDQAASVAPGLPMTPLLWRILEAIGEAAPTGYLPLAFAHVDLDAKAGWRSQIAAAERLVRAGVLAPDVLFALYAEHRAPASGGLWDRADLVRRFEAALASGDTAALAALLPPIWAQMQAAELEVAFARQYAQALRDADPEDPQARRVAHRIGLLGPEPDRTAARMSPTSDALLDDPRGRFLQALLLGDPLDALAPDATTRAVALAFRSPAPSALLTDSQRAALAEGRAAAALFQAMDRLNAAAAGDARGLVDALALMRVVGFEARARQVAVQLVLLDRRG